MTLLSLSSASIRFGANILLRDVTLTVTRGERWGVIGRNGSGKTSLFRLITGELQTLIRRFSQINADYFDGNLCESALICGS